MLYFESWRATYTLHGVFSPFLPIPGSDRRLVPTYSELHLPPATLEREVGRSLPHHACVRVPRMGTEGAGEPCLISVILALWYFRRHICADCVGPVRRFGAVSVPYELSVERRHGAVPSVDSGVLFSPFSLLTPFQLFGASLLWAARRLPVWRFLLFFCHS